jgi:membrane associated rhomboid family serine protease
LQASYFDLFYKTIARVIYLELFFGFVFVISYYFLNINTVIVGASAAIMTILVAVTTYQPLMNVRMLLIGNVKLWHITAVLLILDLMQFRLDNMGGHISHLSGALFGFIYQITREWYRS